MMSLHGSLVLYIVERLEFVLLGVWTRVFYRDSLQQVFFFTGRVENRIASYRGTNRPVRDWIISGW